MAQLFDNGQIMDAAWLSLKIAAMNATGAVILGTMAGFALARFGRFRGRALLAALTTAPLVLPEIITGLSLLLLFVGHGAADRLAARVAASPPSRSRTSAFRCPTWRSSSSRGWPASTTRSRRRRSIWARDRPRCSARITLPLIAPALLSGWLLSFTLSWDDVVISQFVAGPGSSTLPMVIFSKVRLGVSPDVNALATLMVLIVAVGVVVFAWFLRRRERRAAREMQLAAAES